ncbi:MAG: DUF1918 domain-containing protein [Geodermatophilales bacterium]|nr:DUF1918 domain-containing protein [Geodermatophilales bacterium]
MVVHGRNPDDPVGKGLVVEVSHADGGPPSVVGWLDDDRVSLVFPGTDATAIRAVLPPRRAPADR